METRDLQKELQSRVREIVERPVFETSSEEVAFQAISILGREYALSVYGDKAFRINLNHSFNMICDYGELVLFFSKEENIKKNYKLYEITDIFLKKINDGYQICKVVEQVVRNQQKVSIKKEEERIEREEELRAKYRNWR